MNYELEEQNFVHRIICVLLVYIIYIQLGELSFASPLFLTVCMVHALKILRVAYTVHVFQGWKISIST